VVERLFRQRHGPIGSCRARPTPTWWCRWVPLPLGPEATGSSRARMR
jgi:hypothetical protein